MREDKTMFPQKCRQSLTRAAGEKSGMNLRKKTVWTLCLCVIFLGAVTIAGAVLKDSAMATDFARKNVKPCLSYLFGTDWMGRDMWARTLAGLSLSIRIGILSAAVSACIALLLGTVAAVCGKAADSMVSFFIDMIMGIPHILLLLLVSFALGKGQRGVILAVALTHWASLARVIRGEVLQIKGSQYVQVSLKLGQGRIKTAARHILPHVLPQFLTGLILLFPHAILHEASITFLGFGLSAEQPAIGVILSESMQYLMTGKWWLALFPGILLTVTVFLFDRAGNCTRRLLDPKGARE